MASRGGNTGMPLGMDGMHVTGSVGGGEMQEWCRGHGGVSVECAGACVWNAGGVHGGSAWSAAGDVRDGEGARVRWEGCMECTGGGMCETEMERVGSIREM